jgi:hypothetical protein
MLDLRQSSQLKSPQKSKRDWNKTSQLEIASFGVQTSPLSYSIKIDFSRNMYSPQHELEERRGICVDYAGMKSLKCIPIRFSDSTMCCAARYGI